MSKNAPASSLPTPTSRSLSSSKRSKMTISRKQYVGEIVANIAWICWMVIVTVRTVGFEHYAFWVDAIVIGAAIFVVYVRSYMLFDLVKNTEVSQRKNIQNLPPHQ